MVSFLEKSPGLPTRPAHFDADLTNATGYSETELRRTFRADVAAVERFIEQRVSDPLKQLQLADAVDRRFHGIRTTFAAENAAATYGTVHVTVQRQQMILRKRACAGGLLAGCGEPP